MALSPRSEPRRFVPLLPFLAHLTRRPHLLSCPALVFLFSFFLKIFSPYISLPYVLSPLIHLTLSLAYLSRVSLLSRLLTPLPRVSLVVILCVSGLSVFVDVAFCLTHTFSSRPCYLSSVRISLIPLSHTHLPHMYISLSLCLSISFCFPFQADGAGSSS